MECGRGLEAVINLSKKMIDYTFGHWIIFYFYSWTFDSITIKITVQDYIAYS